MAKYETRCCACKGTFMRPSWSCAEICSRCTLEPSIKAFGSSRHLTGFDIKSAREALGLSLSEMAWCCGAEFTDGEVEAWEADKKTIPLQARACIHMALKQAYHSL